MPGSCLCARRTRARAAQARRLLGEVESRFPRAQYERSGALLDSGRQRCEEWETARRERTKKDIDEVAVSLAVWQAIAASRYL